MSNFAPSSEPIASGGPEVLATDTIPELALVGAVAVDAAADVADMEARQSASRRSMSTGAAVGREGSAPSGDTGASSQPRATGQISRASMRGVRAAAPERLQLVATAAVELPRGGGAASAESLSPVDDGGDSGGEEGSESSDPVVLDLWRIFTRYAAPTTTCAAAVMSLEALGQLLEDATLPSPLTESTISAVFAAARTKEEVDSDTRERRNNGDGGIGFQSFMSSVVVDLARGVAGVPSVLRHAGMRTYCAGATMWESHCILLCQGPVMNLIGSVAGALQSIALVYAAPDTGRMNFPEFCNLVRDLGLESVGVNVGGWSAAFLGWAEVPDLWSARPAPRPGGNVLLRAATIELAPRAGRADLSFLGVLACLTGAALAYYPAIHRLSKLSNDIAGCASLPTDNNGEIVIPPALADCCTCILKTLFHAIGLRLRRGAIERIIERRRRRGRSMAPLISGAEALHVRLHSLVVADRGVDTMRIAAALCAGLTLSGGVERMSTHPTEGSPSVGHPVRSNSVGGGSRRQRAHSSYPFNVESVHRYRASTGDVDVLDGSGSGAMYGKAAGSMSLLADRPQSTNSLSTVVATTLSDDIAGASSTRSASARESTGGGSPRVMGVAGASDVAAVGGLSSDTAAPSPVHAASTAPALTAAVGSTLARVADARSVLGRICPHRADIDAAVEWCVGGLFHSFAGAAAAGVTYDADFNDSVRTGMTAQSIAAAVVACGDEALGNWPPTPKLPAPRRRGASVPSVGSSVLDGEAGALVKRHRGSACSVSDLEVSVVSAEVSADDVGNGVLTTGESPIPSPRSIDTANGLVATAGPSLSIVEWAGRSLRVFLRLATAARDVCGLLTSCAVELCGARARVTSLLPCAADILAAGRTRRLARASALRAMGAAAMLEAAIHSERGEWALDVAISTLREAFVRTVSRAGVAAGASVETSRRIRTVSGGVECLAVGRTVDYNGPTGAAVRVVDVSGDYSRAMTALDDAVQALERCLILRPEWTLAEVTLAACLQMRGTLCTVILVSMPAGSLIKPLPLSLERLLPASDAISIRDSDGVGYGPAEMGEHTQQSVWYVAVRRYCRDRACLLVDLARAVELLRNVARGEPKRITDMGLLALLSAAEDTLVVHRELVTVGEANVGIDGGVPARSVPYLFLSDPMVMLDAVYDGIHGSGEEIAGLNATEILQLGGAFGGALPLAETDIRWLTHVFDCDSGKLTRRGLQQLFLWTALNSAQRALDALRCVLRENRFDCAKAIAAFTTRQVVLEEIKLVDIPTLTAAVGSISVSPQLNDASKDVSGTPMQADRSLETLAAATTSPVGARTPASTPRPRLATSHAGLDFIASTPRGVASDVKASETAPGDELPTDPHAPIEDGLTTAKWLEYFAVVAGGELDLEHTDVDFVCSARSRVEDVILRPVVLDRFPLCDYADVALPENIGTFCFPSGGVKLHSQEILPLCFDYVLTGPDGATMYCTALIRYEPVDPAVVAGLLLACCGEASELPPWLSDGTGTRIFAPKCLTVVSRHPFFGAFRAVLCQLLRMSITPGVQDLLGHYVAAVVYDVPLPPPGRVQVGFRMCDTEFIIARPPLSDLPFIGTPIKPLFMCLDVEHVVEVFTALLLQAKIALCSSQLSLLTPCCEALRAFIFPFAWEMAYIPVLPDDSIEFLGMPSSYLIGYCGPAAAAMEFANDVVFVDLDMGIVHAPREAPLPSLPESLRKALISALKKACGPVLSNSLLTLKPTMKHGAAFCSSFRTSMFAMPEDAVPEVPGGIRPVRTSGPIRRQSFVPVAEDEDSDGFSARKIRQAFLSFMATLLHNYRNFISVRKHDDDRAGAPFSVAFASTAFIEANAASANLLQELVQTSLFQRYIDMAAPIVAGSLSLDAVPPRVKVFDDAMAATSKQRSGLFSSRTVEAGSLEYPEHFECILGVPEADDRQSSGTASVSLASMPASGAESAVLTLPSPALVAVTPASPLPAATNPPAGGAGSANGPSFLPPAASTPLKAQGQTPLPVQPRYWRFPRLQFDKFGSRRRPRRQFVRSKIEEEALGRWLKRAQRPIQHARAPSSSFGGDELRRMSIVASMEVGGAPDNVLRVKRNLSLTSPSVSPAIADLSRPSAQAKLPHEPPEK